MVGVVTRVVGWVAARRGGSLEPVVRTAARAVAEVRVGTGATGITACRRRRLDLVDT